MLMKNNVNMVTHESLFIKESAKHMQNTCNADLDAGVILAKMWKEDVLWTPFTEYPRQKLKIDKEIYIYILSVYSPFSDRVGLPLHNIHIPFPFTFIMDIFFVDLKSGHIHFYTL